MNNQHNDAVIKVRPHAHRYVACHTARTVVLLVVELVVLLVVLEEVELVVDDVVVDVVEDCAYRTHVHAHSAESLN